MTTPIINEFLVRFDSNEKISGAHVKRAILEVDPLKPDTPAQLRVGDLEPVDIHSNHLQEIMDEVFIQSLSENIKLKDDISELEMSIEQLNTDLENKIQEYNSLDAIKLALESENLELKSKIEEMESNREFQEVDSSSEDK